MLFKPVLGWASAWGSNTAENAEMASLDGSDIEAIVTFLKNVREANYTRGSYNCWLQFDTVLWIFYGAAISLPLTIAMSFTMQRQMRCLKCCGGRPGVAFPWDILVYRSRRAQTVLSMLLLCYPSYLLVQKSTIVFDLAPPDATWVSTPIKIAGILLTGLSLHPIFLSSSQPCTLTHILALLMAAYQSVIVILPLMMCIDDEDPASLAIDILYAFPSVAAGLALVVMLTIRLAKSIMKGNNFLPSNQQEKSRKYLERKQEYVRQLLRQTYRLQTAQMGTAISETSDPRKANFFRKILQKVEQNVKKRREDAFYYPVTVLCSMAASFTLIYYTLLWTVTTVLSVSYDLDDLWFNPYSKVNDTRTMHEIFKNVTSDGELDWMLILTDMDGLIRIVSFVFRSFIAILVSSSVLTSLTGVSVLTLIFINYRANVLRAYAGNYKDLVPRANVKPSRAVVGLCRYGGYQLGYIAWAMLFQFFTYTWVMSFIWYTMIMPIVYNYDIWFTSFIKRIWPTILIAFLLGLLQANVPRFAFVVDNGRKLAIRRRTIFMVWSYYSFIISTVMGLVSCLLRLVKAFVIAFVFLARLDWCSLPPRFRFLDGGHSAYMGQLYSDVSHSHPVMITFIEILKRGAEETRRKRFINRDCVAQEQSTETSPLANSGSNLCDAFDSSSTDSILNEPAVLGEVEVEVARADNRRSVAVKIGNASAERSVHAKKWKWYVAYTLINNPTLLQDRKTLLLKKRRVQVEEESII